MQTNEKSKKAIKNNGIPRRTRQKAQQADTPGEYPMMLHLKKGVLSAQRDTRKELACKEKRLRACGTQEVLLIFVIVLCSADKCNIIWNRNRTLTKQTNRQEAKSMYKAKNGFTLHNDETPGGWTIRNAQDIITALLAYPYFQTVDTGILWEAIGQAVERRKEYADIKEFAGFLAENYI